MADHRHCRDFSRSELLRHGVAAAGQGLPDVEAGMPEPAGTGLDRRAFLLRSAGLALSVYGAGKLAGRILEDGVAQAATGQRVLVSVFLPGGLDSLSVLAPVGDPKYRTLRPTLALPSSAGTAFAEDSRLRWHPSAAGLSTLHGEGKVSVFPAIGYDHPDQSHFTSRHFWEVGELSANARQGWMGRYLDVVGTPDNPVQGLSLNGSLSPALATSQVPVSALSAPDDYSFWAENITDDMAAPMLSAFGTLGQANGASPAIQQARSAAANAARLRGLVAPFGSTNGTPGYTSPVPYPAAGEFSDRLAALAAMLGAGLPIRCAALDGVGGYDTHSDQAGTLTANLKQTVDAVLAFQRDLEARGLADRVLIQLWSSSGGARRRTARAPTTAPRAARS